MHAVFLKTISISTIPHSLSEGSKEGIPEWAQSLNRMLEMVVWFVGISTALTWLLGIVAIVWLIVLIGRK